MFNSAWSVLFYLIGVLAAFMYLYFEAFKTASQKSRRAFVSGAFAILWPLVCLLWGMSQLEVWARQ